MADINMTREEAIKVLEESKRQNEVMRDNPNTFYKTSDIVNGMKNAQKRIDAIQMAISALREQEERRWIPVTERLPDNDDFVLVVASGQAGNIRLDNAFELGQFSMSEGWILEMWPEWEDPKVTHWMPMPEPPEAEAALEGGDEG